VIETEFGVRIAGLPPPIIRVYKLAPFIPEVPADPELPDEPADPDVPDVPAEPLAPIIVSLRTLNDPVSPALFITR
jgi:hypothetical protein